MSSNLTSSALYRNPLKQRPKDAVLGFSGKNMPLQAKNLFFFGFLVSPGKFFVLFHFSTGVAAVERKSDASVELKRSAKKGGGRSYPHFFGKIRFLILYTEDAG